MKKEILSLIEKYMDYTSETGEVNLKDFSVWLNRSLSGEEPVIKAASPSQTERDIIYLINRLSKFSRFYSKKVISRYGLTSLDEFYFLISITRLGTPGKNEVYKDTITEVTTGAQIMKRMIAAGLITEVTDKEDKRMKRVRLSDKGKKVRDRLFSEFTETVKLKTGNLSGAEKETLRTLLADLHTFHISMYDKDADKPVEFLLNKYIVG